RVSLCQPQRQFNTIKVLDDDGDAEKRAQQVEWLKRKIEEQGERITDSSYVNVLLNCAPPQYDVQISIVKAQSDVIATIIINRLLEEGNVASEALSGVHDETHDGAPDDINGRKRQQ